MNGDIKFIEKRFDKLEKCIENSAKENRDEHQGLNDKMDTWPKLMLDQANETHRSYTSTKVTGWIIIILIVLFSTLFTMDMRDSKALSDHRLKVREYKVEANDKLDHMREDVDAIREVYRVP